ncbi:MAG TPA: SigB/SigF/SigG family RNA polymerase sigma factor [Acidimicrobiia bacterium]|nr:SigB/SigF/SigG family RNA polymerase sigma factor [Acidimicrobiia bacterium]
MNDEKAAPLFDLMPDPAARRDLFDLYRPLALHLANRYAYRGLESEDLRQVAFLGLLNAIDRYDPCYGSRFISFAVPTITGEIKRYFRDAGWATAVPRRLKDITVLCRRVDEELTQRLGRSPTVEEISAETGLTPHEVTEAAALGTAYRPDALEAQVRGEGTTRMDFLGHHDPRMDQFDDLDALKPLLEARPERERRILHLRFYENLTQRQIAEEMDISQMHVSRILTSTLEKLRVLMDA